MIPHQPAGGRAGLDNEEMAMSQEKQAAGSSRRDFLKMASLSAPAAAAVAVTSQEAAAEIPDSAGDGLRDTAHVRAYLESARF